MTINVKKLVTAVVIVLAVVLLGGVIVNLTNVGKKVNEDNLLYDTYSSMKETTDSNGMTVSQNNGVISIKGKTTKDASTLIKITDVALDAGTYTYTCFDKPTTDTYYSYIEYTDDNVLNRVFADFDTVQTSAAGTVQHAKTFTITERTTVTVYIVVAADTECNIKAYPTLVSGVKPGSFFE